MNKIFLFFIVIIVAVAGLLFFQRGHRQASLTQSGTEYAIQLSDDGYSPKNLTVQKGDTVKFTTVRDSHFWPASSLHPSHRIYPDFDPQEPIAVEDSWSFTFREVGNWRYHDHISPYYTGEIEVVE